MAGPGIWLINAKGEIVSASVQADSRFVERLTQEAIALCRHHHATSALDMGGHQWIRLFRVEHAVFDGVIAVWDDHSDIEKHRLEVQSIAHDIVNLVAVAKGRLELLNDNALEDLYEIGWVLDRVVDMARRLVQPDTAGRAYSPHTPVQEPLRHLVAILSDSRYRVQWDVPSTRLWVRMSTVEFTEVFQNLLQNACEAMPDGGTIALQVRPSHGKVSITVRDTGRGVPSQTLEMIFTPRFTTKPLGQGLGLYRSRQLVERAGGTITAISTHNVGTTVVVSLPRVSEYDILDTSKNSGMP